MVKMTQTSQRYEITILNPLFPIERKNLDPERTTSVGRSIECVIPIRDRYLSRHHVDLIERSEPPREPKASPPREAEGRARPATRHFLYN